MKYVQSIAGSILCHTRAASSKLLVVLELIAVQVGLGTEVTNKIFSRFLDCLAAQLNDGIICHNSNT